MREVALQLAPMSDRCELIAHADGSGGAVPFIAGLLASLKRSGGTPVLLIMRAHGLMMEWRGLDPISRMQASVPDGGGFVLKIDENTLSSGTRLFQTIGMVRKAPVHIFMTSCFGRPVLEASRHLPEGSVVVVLASEGQAVLSADVDALYAKVGQLKCLSAYGLLLLHCACAMTQRISPSVYLPNGVIIDLETQLDAVQGHAVSASARFSIHQQLDDLMGADEVNASIALIESCDPISDEAYGKALAVAAVLSGLTVDPGAVAPRNAQATVHNVLSGTEEFVDPPALNMDHEHVKSMLARRGQVIILPDRSALVYGKTIDCALLKFEGETIKVVLAVDRSAGMLKVKTVEGPLKAIAHFQRIGVLRHSSDFAVQAAPGQAFDWV